MMKGFVGFGALQSFLYSGINKSRTSAEIGNPINILAEIKIWQR